MNEEDKIALYPPEELKAISDREDKARVKREKELDDLRAVLLIVSGRRFMWNLLGELGLFRSPFVNGNAELTAFRCGQHDLALKILADIEEAVPGIYSRMTNEYRSAQTPEKDK